MRKIIMVLSLLFIPAAIGFAGEDKVAGSALKDNAAGSTLMIGGFSPGAAKNSIANGWEPLYFKKIKSHSVYTLKHENDNYFVEATSNAAASGLIRKVPVDLKRYPVLKWRWKVENILARGDVRHKNGDDFPARIYITFQYAPASLGMMERLKYKTYKMIYGEFPPQGAISYIWANHLPAGEMVDNAYTDRVKMIAVESGVTHLGKWLDEERNVYEDFRKLFGYEPPLISGIAIMTDSDNTGGRTHAFFDEIRFVKPEPQSP